MFVSAFSVIMRVYILSFPVQKGAGTPDLKYFVLVLVKLRNMWQIFLLMFLEEPYYAYKLYKMHIQVYID
jgi:hypothetical protein